MALVLPVRLPSGLTANYSRVISLTFDMINEQALFVVQVYASKEARDGNAVPAWTVRPQIPFRRFLEAPQALAYGLLAQMDVTDPSNGLSLFGAIPDEDHDVYDGEFSIQLVDEETWLAEEALRVAAEREQHEEALRQHRLAVEGSRFVPDPVNPPPDFSAEDLK